MSKQAPLGIEDEFLEKLAAIEHNRWTDWQQWVHKCLKPNPMGEIFPYLLDPEWYERWDKQIETPYERLSESEKQSDRDQVMRYWPLIVAWHDRLVKEALREVDDGLLKLAEENNDNAQRMIAFLDARRLLIHDSLAQLTQKGK